MIRTLFAMIFLMASSAMADVYSDISNAKLIYGSAPGSLKGKVILFEYWGLN